jgi:hypothetical protein
MTRWPSTAAAAAALLAAGALMTAPPAAAHWQKPWAEPQDPAAAANASDEYAWRLFVALNWPADPVARRADSRAKLGADRPPVWQTWQSAGEVYLDDGADPGPWTNLGGPELAPERRFEIFSLREMPNARRIVAGAMVPVVDPLASVGRLTEIRMNRTAFDYIRARELYNLEGQMRAFSRGPAVSFPAGAKEVKAKWRPISERERSRYYSERITHADGTTRWYGLTALHIVSKDLPNWFWATFEHVDNPLQPDGEGWQLPSRDRFSCKAAEDCKAAPRNIGLEGTVWENYRLRGTLTDFVDSRGQALRLANSELETGMQTSASCITCHARASIGVVAGSALRLPIFDLRGAQGGASTARRGYVGMPQAQWFEQGDSDGGRPVIFQRQDFVWSLSKAKSTQAAPAAVMGDQ